MINEHYAKKGGNQGYRTPLDLAQDVRGVFGGSIGLDPCTEPGNHLRAEVFYAPPQDGLQLPWMDRTWCNPPYESIYAWFLKVIEESRQGYRIGVLTSVARTEQDCTQVFAHHASCIQFLKGKLKHSEGKQAMLASMIYWFNVPPEAVVREMGWRGMVLTPH